MRYLTGVLTKRKIRVDSNHQIHRSALEPCVTADSTFSICIPCDDEENFYEGCT